MVMLSIWTYYVEVFSYYIWIFFIVVDAIIFQHCMTVNNRYIYHDLIDITLCKTGDRFHNISCMKRQCDNCGVQYLKLLD
jgi:hypothetical protein